VKAADIHLVPQAWNHPEGLLSVRRPIWGPTGPNWRRKILSDHQGDNPRGDILTSVQLSERENTEVENLIRHLN
jgi:hypothetical protein